MYSLLVDKSDVMILFHLRNSFVKLSVKIYLIVPQPAQASKLICQIMLTDKALWIQGRYFRGLYKL